VTAVDEPDALDDSDVLRRHFVAIATADYDDPNYPALPGVTAEVQELQTWLCDGGRLGGRAFRPPADLAPLAQGPTAEQIRVMLRHHLRLWTDADAAAVFITGHGEVADGSHWLVLRDSESTDLATTALRTSDFVRGLMSSGVRHLLLIVDACFAGGSMADLARLDRDLPPSWLVLPSAMKGETATTGALSTAIAKAVDKLHGGQGEKYGLDAPYFTVEQFLATVREFLGDGQRVTPLYGSQTSGPHLCLPNPHFAAPSVVPTRAPRHELALPKRDLQTHWAPRARGIVHADGGGWLFTGRAALMRELIRTAAGKPGTTLITGVAGCGKSAVLARLVTLSDPDFLSAYAEQVAPIPPDLRPEPEAVDVAIVATRKWPHEILGQLFGALAVPRPQTTSWDATGLAERIDAWTTWLADHDSVVTIVLDALDEAHDPRAVAAMLGQLTSGAAAAKMRLLVGVRSPGGPDDPSTGHDPHPAAGLGRPLADDVEAMLHACRLRVDEYPWWDQDDVRDYAASVLRNTPGSPYALAEHEDAAAGIARVLADRAARSFLVARIAASSLADRPHLTLPSDSAWLAAVDDGVLGVFRDDLQRSFTSRHDRERAVVLLRAVAFAFGRGLPWGDIWPLVANAAADTYARYGDGDIAWLLASPMSAYLVTDRENDTTVYRLFHDTLRSTLRERWNDLLQDPCVVNGSPEPADEITATHARIAARLTGLSTPDHAEPPAYVRRHLVEHAHAGQVLDLHILTPSFLPFADPVTLLPLLSPADPELRDVARVYRRARPLLGADIPANAAYLQEAAIALTGTTIGFSGTKIRPLYNTLLASVRADDSLLTLTTHGNFVTSVAFGAATDGPVLLASIGTEGMVWLWDPATGAPATPPLALDTEWVTALAFTAGVGGRVLLAYSGGDDGTVWLWDPATGAAATPPLTGHTGQVTSLAFTAGVGGRVLLASGGGDGTVRLWDPATGAAATPPLTGHTGQVYSVAFSPDGRLLASGGDDGTVRLWDPATGAAAGPPLTGHAGGVGGVAFSPDGRLLASGGHDGTVRLWDPATGAAAGPPLWDPATGARVGPPLPRYAGGVGGVAFSPDGRLLAGSGGDGTVRLWDPATGAAAGPPLTGHTWQVTELVFTAGAGGRVLLASASYDGTVRLWDPATGARAGPPLTGHAGRVGGVAFSPDGRLLASGGDDGTVRLWDPATGAAATPPLTGHAGRVGGVAFSPDGRLLASGDDDGTVRLWDPATGAAATPPLTGHTGQVYSVAFSPDGRLLASGGGDGPVRLWDPATGAAAGPPLTGHIGQVHSVAFGAAADGRVLLAYGGDDDDGTVRLWDPATGAPAGPPLPGHADWVTSLAFGAGADGRVLLASGDVDGTVRLWDPATGAPATPPLTGHTDWVTSLAFTAGAGGRVLLASGSYDCTVRMWDLATAACVSTLRRRSVVNSVAVAGALLAIGDTEGVSVVDLNA
jgi:WD40 repeat protein